MNGFQLTFFTQQGQHQGHQAMDRWLIELARSLGVGATSTAGVEGVGHNGRLHSAHFIELADQPIEVTMVASQEQAERLLASVSTEVDQLFYVKVPVVFGRIGTGVAQEAPAS
ncbi:MAG: DUF190 domain-containing protein [Comamonadaceae bacterium]|jgi:PII-like signaling protein|nr:DUF190 domain-containing protein [Comamonadaceae bacterium]